MTTVPLPPSAARFRALLDAGREPTKDEAAARLGLSCRSITRLVAVLRDADVPVQERRDGRAKRFFLAPEDQRRGLDLGDLDEAALLALTVAADAARAQLAGTPLAEPLGRAYRRLLDAARAIDGGLGPGTFDPEDEPHHWHFGPAAIEPLDPDVFAAVHQAIGAARRVRVDYRRKDGTPSFGRQLSPLALALVRGTWQLAAYCHERSALRDFNLVRMTNVRRLSAAAHAPDGFDAQAHFAGRFGALQGGAPVEVRLRVTPERAVHFRSRRYHPSQVADDRPGGALEVRYRVPGGDALDEVRAFVASWGPHVVVEAPPELAARLADDARQTAAAYGEVGSGREMSRFTDPAR